VRERGKVLGESFERLQKNCHSTTVGEKRGKMCESPLLQVWHFAILSHFIILLLSHVTRRRLEVVEEVGSSSSSPDTVSVCVVFLAYNYEIMLCMHRFVCLFFYYIFKINRWKNL
jgi:hypothetical protein